MTMRYPLIAAMVLLAGSLATPPASAGVPDKMISLYHDLDRMCRGGPGDSDATNDACDARNKASNIMRDLGYCFRGSGADSAWAKCR